MSTLGLSDTLTYLIIVVLKIVSILITFGYAAISDWIKREIKPIIWIPSIIIGIIINLYLYIFSDLLKQVENFVKIHICISLVVSATMIVLMMILSFVFKFVGGADVMALISFSSIYPSNLELLYKVLANSFSRNLVILLMLPPILLVFMIYTATTIITIVINILLNIPRINEVKKYRLSLIKMMIYITLGRVMKVKEFLLKRFYYPLYIPGVIERLFFDIDEEYQIWIERLRTLDPETIIIVTWGMPMVTLIAIAIYIYVIVYLSLILL